MTPLQEGSRIREVADAFSALPRDLRRDPYGYDLSDNALYKWAVFAHDNYLGVDHPVTRHDLATRMADANVIGQPALPHVGSSIEELAEDEHFLPWADAAISVLRMAK